jgi:hypothetical protein
MSALNEHPKANRRRALVATAIVPSLCAGAAAMYFWASPAAVDPTTLPTADPTATAAIHGAQERQAGDVSLAVAIAPRADLTRSAAAGVEQTPSVAWVPEVGASAAMQDYGQIVIAAINDGAPKQLGRAVTIMSICRFALDMSQTVERLKSEGTLSGEGATVATQHFSERERECQSIPPDLMTRQKELAERAMLGGARGVAIIYADLVGFDPPASMRRPLGEALRADFLEGDYIASRMLATHAELFELSRVETRAYEIAFETEKSRRGRSWNLDDFAKPTPALSEEERRQAQELAQTWLRSVNRADRRQAFTSK